ncbi:asparaginase [Thermanaerovibrio velox DSM 12556]|uniref:Asparaginase n=1 Tax=Thermanaerovibrio velox DSM 12556 TaxID=926567 RepID=H0UPE6_9BACT|nr:N(4)-(beta-N-acetylglucosaminyl)-L-asparaginase [Thermanaerovibrio velox]EHM10577.1 asparaginase [Thermanaerovibrio velox DSM 12556]
MSQVIPVGWVIGGTWRMCLEGISLGGRILAEGGSAGDAVCEAVKVVEDEPRYKSVGFGGLPNGDCQVELDAAFMDGDTLDFGAVAAVRDVKNPVMLARRLSSERFNTFLVGQGAQDFARVELFEMRNMLTPRAKRAHEIRRRRMLEENLSPYDGHDTVGVVALDLRGSMACATSTSGLFMKRPGRVGDSPLCGSGLYCDSRMGAAVATGLGEDIMKGALSYETVRLMGEGFSADRAARRALREFEARVLSRGRKVGAISIICCSPRGDIGVATNVEFSFAWGSSCSDPKVYIARPTGEDGDLSVEEASSHWLEAYERRLNLPPEEVF